MTSFYFVFKQNSRVDRIDCILAYRKIYKKNIIIYKENMAKFVLVTNF